MRGGYGQCDSYAHVILMSNVESSGNMISKLPASKAVRLASPSYTRTRSRGNPCCKQRIVFNNCLPQRRYIQPRKTHGSRKFSNSVEWMHRDAGPKVKARDLHFAAREASQKSRSAAVMNG